MVIHAQLRRLHSPDVQDLERYVPQDAESFGILVQALIGPKESPGEESFDFLVCSPRWLATQIADRGQVFGRHYLFLLRYDYTVMWQTIDHLCVQAQGDSWQVIAEYLGRYGHWEYEDYRP